MIGHGSNETDLTRFERCGYMRPGIIVPNRETSLPLIPLSTRVSQSLCMAVPVPFYANTCTIHVYTPRLLLSYYITPIAEEAVPPISRSLVSFVCVMTSLVPWGGVTSRRGAYDPFSWDVWDPTSDLGLGFGGRGLGDLWDVGRRFGDDETTAIARTYVDWRETDDAHVFRADLPGVRREELKVQVEDGNILEISGEKTKEEETSTDTWHRAERRHGSFRRRFRLPDDVDITKTNSNLSHGVLTVTVPKVKVGMPQRNIRAIEIS